MTKNNKPANEIRLGSLKATIWANTSDDGRTRYNATLTRLYKVEPENDKDSGWRETASLGTADLQDARRLLDEVDAWARPAKHKDQEGE